MSDHEHRDADIGNIVKLGTLLLGVLALALVVMWLMFRYLSGGAAPRLSSPAAAEAPSQPLLQVQPQTDLERMRATEEAILNSYGWVDREAGIVRIPIDRAMEVLAARASSATPAQARKK